MGRIINLKLKQINGGYDDLIVDEEGSYIKTFLLNSDKHEVGNWKELRESLMKGYQPEKYSRGHIRVFKSPLSDRYHVYEGNHRTKLLKEMYDNEYEVEVIVVDRYETLVGFIAFIFVIPLYLIKRIINLVKINKK